MKQSVTIVGGGIIGLSIAYELLQRDWAVTVIDRDHLGRSASWAGAGILLPANRLTANHPIEHLSALSNSLHAQWSDRLREETGVDNGFHRCGGLYVARSTGELASLSGVEFQLRDQKIDFEVLDRKQIEDLEFVQSYPDALAGVQRALALTNESQVCNPHHISALIAACKKRDATLIENSEVTAVEMDSRRNVLAISAAGESFHSDHFVFTSGAWTEKVVGHEFKLPILPVRGQMVMFKLPEQIFKPIVYEGSHYLVPRRDGYVLAGATIEEVGFDMRNTESAITMLQQFAERQFPQLNESTQVAQWAGLRPTTFDGFPYIGRLTDSQNGWVATGHFRLGIQLSTGTAVVLSDMLEGKAAGVELSPLSPQRVF